MKTLEHGGIGIIISGWLCNWAFHYFDIYSILNDWWLALGVTAAICAMSITESFWRLK